MAIGVLGFFRAVQETRSALIPILESGTMEVGNERKCH